MKMILPLLLLTSSAFAQTASEEAIILNQELQFLENSANELNVIQDSVSAKSAKDISPEEMSLERTYFSENERDEVRTRRAAPQRARSF